MNSIRNCILPNWWDSDSGFKTEKKCLTRVEPFLLGEVYLINYSNRPITVTLTRPLVPWPNPNPKSKTYIICFSLITSLQGCYTIGDFIGYIKETIH